MRMQRAVAAGAVLAAVLATGCGGDGGGGSGPVAGVLTVSVATGVNDGGALMLRVTGGPVDAVEAASGYRVFSAGTGPTSVRVIVTGTILPGAVVRLHVPDTRDVARYAAVVEQASARTSYAQQAAANFTLSIAASP